MKYIYTIKHSKMGNSMYLLLPKKTKLTCDGHHGKWCLVARATMPPS